MKKVKTMAVGAVAAALLLGTAGWASDLQTTTTHSQQTTQVQRVPSDDALRGVPGQDSDIHGTSGSAIQDDAQGVGGSGLIQDNAVQNHSASDSITLDPSLGRVGSGGTGDLDRNQQGDMKMGSDTNLGVGGSGDTTTTTTKTTKKTSKGKNASEHSMGTPKNATGTSTNLTGANEGVDKNPTQPNPNRTKDPAPAPTPTPAPTP